jgi:dissimilatory sulfite reductase (desulfoviridin) alpha/beta subunit
MSDYSETVECIRCGGQQKISHSSKDLDCNSSMCYGCGQTFKMVESQMTLEDLNEMRVEAGMKQLSELPPPEGKEWFNVSIAETFIKIVRISATSPGEAVNRAEYLYAMGEIRLDSDDKLYEPTVEYEQSFTHDNSIERYDSLETER